MTKRNLSSLMALCLLGAIMITAGVRVTAQQQAAPPLQPKAVPPRNWIDPRNPPKEDPNFVAPKTKDGQPDLQGAWNNVSAISTYSIEDPEGVRGTHLTITGQAPTIGRPIIDPVSGKIPYKPWAADLANFLYDQHTKPSKPEYLDPVSRGFMRGVPRANYQGEFHITQFKDAVLITYDYFHEYRLIYLDNRPHLGQNIKLWMGDSRGRFEGNTLVVDVTNNTDQTWYQIVGSPHTDKVRYTERWTMVSPNHLKYVVTVTDPDTYTQPWHVRVDMTRREQEELWENAVWEGNRLGGLPQEFWGGAKK